MTRALLFWSLLLVMLFVGRMFLYPIALGVLFALLLLPIAARLELWGAPRIVANLVSIVLGVGVVYGVMFFLYKQFGVLLDDLPQIKESALRNMHSVANGLGGRFGVPVTPEIETMLLDRLETAAALTGDTLSNILNATGNTLLAIGLMPVYVFLFLYYRDKFARFILMLVPDQARDMGSEVLGKVAAVSMKYMTGMSLVVLILSVLNSVGFLIIGLDYAILFGLIAAGCNFIPYFGTIIGYLFPFVYAFLAGATPDLALAVLLQFFIIQFTENNIITPNIVGGMLRVNPFFIITGVLGGGMLWGLPGMFVVVPVLGMTKVLCDHVPGLRPWGFLLGDKGTEKHSITARKIRRLFAFSSTAKADVVDPEERGPMHP